MARTLLAVQNVPQFNGLTPIVWTAVDSVNGMMFPNDGQTIVLVRNNDAASKTATMRSIADEHGRTGDIALIVPAASGGVPGEAIFNPENQALFNQVGADAGNVYLDFSAATATTVAVLRINKGV